MKKGAPLLLLALVLGFAAGMLWLFNLRFEAGDVYPAYSSLRADPLGARALHDSLDNLRSVQRNFEPVTKLGDGRGAGLLYLGVPPDEARFAPHDQRAIETFVRSGGRLVLAFRPTAVVPRINRFGTGRPPPATTPPPPTAGTNRPVRQTRNPEGDRSLVPITEAWSIDFSYASLEREADGSPRAAVAQPPADAPVRSNLPTQLQVHTALGFAGLGPDWRIVYTRTDKTNDLPVVIEKALGGGSIVLFADAFPFSNEALRDQRQPQLLSWALGGSDRVIFEETHLGTRLNPGIATMARRYRLHGLAAALAVLAGLFVWRRSVAFLPPSDAVLSSEATHQVTGKESAEGFIQLLRRSIPPVDLLKVCLNQWNQAAAGRKPAAAKLDAMQRIIDEQNALGPRQRDPVNTYRQFCAILATARSHPIENRKSKIENSP